MIIGKYARTLAMALPLCAMAIPARAQNPTPAADAQPGAVSRSVGTVKAINDKALVLKTDAGAEITVTLPEGTRIVRLAPGQTDLKSATPMTLGEVQIGDRMLVRGRTGDNGALAATSIVVMKQSDVAQKQQRDLQDWQRRGAGGIVSAIDAPGGVVTVAVTPILSIAIKIGKDTVFLRYASNSVKFADAQKGTFDQIKAGDQLRARGNKSADGKEIAAEEVISGTFRNIAGTVSSIDAANNSITVKDVLAKKSVVVKFNSDSQLRKLAPQMAQRLAFFLKGGAAQGAPASGAQPAAATGAAPQGGPGAAAAGPRPGGGGADFSQILSRIPSITLADLQKEDAVMIVAMQSTNPGEATAVTLLGGVEPILTASPNGMSAAALFSGWNLGAPGGDAGPQ
ncbi:MAG TPA: DUF5666 domain-containing protein [Candidatus Angelobacter sp.]|nr:DUF5666 domain-containing protein [Candidatus Angelobacter sp.]